MLQTPRNMTCRMRRKSEVEPCSDSGHLAETGSLPHLRTLLRFTEEFLFGVLKLSLKRQEPFGVLFVTQPLGKTGA